MKPAEDKMREVFRDIEFRDANFPIIQNVHGEAVTEAEKLKENLILQVSRPVRWVKCVETLAALGISRCVELGAGKVIAGLIKKIDSEHLNTLNITSIQELRAVEKLFHAEGF
jgi:[acyl-carrier-protein] S-malonyltransferase